MTQRSCLVHSMADVLFEMTVKLVLNIQTVFVNNVCELCSRIVFANTFVLNTKTTVRELPGSFLMTTNFEAIWPVIDSHLK